MTWASITAVTSDDGTPIVVRSLGDGPGLIVVGGALQTADDYLGLARLLAPSFAVHVVDRRGRGGSGPYGDGYTIETEVRDLAAVVSATDSRLAFGHSYGGLIVLESLAAGSSLVAAAVYEPGVSIGGSIPTGWVPRYRELLARGDEYGAFALFIHSSPQAPAVVRLMPQWYLRLALHAMPGFRQRIAPLLEGSALEHEQVAALADRLDTLDRITSRLAVFVGGRSPAFVAATATAIAAHVTGATVLTLPGLGHMAPMAERPVALADALTGWLTRPDDTVF